MAPANPYRQHPRASSQRGLPALGFEVLPPDEVEVLPVDQGPTLIRCSEAGVGELEISVFGGGLIIDRDGTLQAKASDQAGAPAVRVSLPGASGYRANTVDSGPLPYLYVFAVAPRDLGVDAGVVVTVRCKSPAWPAADQVLHSLRLITRLGRHPTQPANDDSGVTPVPLPLVGRNDDD